MKLHSCQKGKAVGCSQLHCLLVEFKVSTFLAAVAGAVVEARHRQVHRSHERRRACAGVTRGPTEGGRVDDWTTLHSTAQHCIWNGVSCIRATEPKWPRAPIDLHPCCAAQVTAAQAHRRRRRLPRCRGLPPPPPCAAGLPRPAGPAAPGLRHRPGSHTSCPAGEGNVGKGRGCYFGHHCHAVGSTECAMQWAAGAEDAWPASSKHHAAESRSTGNATEPAASPRPHH